MEQQLKDLQKEVTIIIKNNGPNIAKLWDHFQKFVDMQGFDKVKILRSKDYSLETKIFCIEWLARYMPFITPNLIVQGVKEMKELYQDPDNQ